MSLVILTPIIIAGLQTLRVSAHRLQQEKKHHSRLESLSIVDFYLQRAVEANDAHRLPLLPRVHFGGAIRLADGTPLSISYPPDSNSAALTGFMIDSPNSLWVVARDLMTNSVTACFQYALDAATANSWTVPRGFLGLSTSNISELIVKASRRSSERCYQITVSETPSMATPVTATPLEFISLLMPITEIFSIYLAQSGDLRYLSHLGDQIIENQPLGLGPRHLEFNLEAVPHLSGIAQVTARLNFEAAAQERVLQSFHHLSPLSIEMFLGNRMTP